MQIRVYHDKIRISNVGSLPEDWTVETLLGEHSSEPFNPEIASTFFRAGYIESWGRGVNTVIELSKAYNGTVPKFKFLNGLTVEFVSNYPNKRLGDKEKTREKIIDLIKEDATITTQELAEILEITPKGVEWQIQKLKKEGVLSRVGAKKGGKWVVL